MIILFFHCDLLYYLHSQSMTLKKHEVLLNIQSTYSCMSIYDTKYILKHKSLTYMNMNYDYIRDLYDFSFKLQI